MVYELVIILALILVNGIFAGSEIAVVSLRRTRVRELVDGGSRAALAVQTLREHPERFLATVQIGITVVGATASAFGGASLARRLEGPLEALPGVAPFADQIALGVVVVGVSFFSLVLGELVPKSLALRSSEAYALFMGRPLVALSWLARPLVWVLTASSNLVLRVFGDRTDFMEARMSSEELQQLLEEASKSGSVHPGAGEIASRALAFSELTAEDVMVPRREVVGVPLDASVEDLRRVLLEGGHARMPVYDGHLDSIVGYVTWKDVLGLAWEQRVLVLKDAVRAPYFVPESKRAVTLLQELRERRQPFAIVVDESGGTAGIITIEDLVEELVGEIFSEHAPEEPLTMRREPDNSVVALGSVSVRDVNREFDLDLPEEGDWTSIAGLCLGVARRIPAQGESLVVPGGSTIEVLDATARRVKLVRIRPA